MKINDFPDDNLVAKLVTDCLNVMKDYPTVTKLTACYNLTERILRLFTVQNEKEVVNKLIDEFHVEIKKEISQMYS